MAHSAPKVQLPSRLEEELFGESPRSRGEQLTPVEHSPVTPASGEGAERLEEGEVSSLVSSPAPMTEEEIQGFGALLAGRYRPGPDWIPDPLPTDPLVDTVVG